MIIFVRRSYGVICDPSASLRRLHGVIFFLMHFYDDCTVLPWRSLRSQCISSINQRFHYN